MSEAPARDALRGLGEALSGLAELRSLKITLDTWRRTADCVGVLLDPLMSGRQTAAAARLELRFEGCGHAVISEALRHQAFRGRLTGLSVVPARPGVPRAGVQRDRTVSDVQRSVEGAIVLHAASLARLELDLSALPDGSLGRLVGWLDTMGADGCLLQLTSFSLTCDEATRNLSADAAATLGGDLIRAISRRMPRVASLRLLCYRDDLLLFAIKAMGAGGAGVGSMECLRSLELLALSTRTDWAEVGMSSPSIPYHHFLISNLDRFCPKLTGLSLSPSLAFTPYLREASPLRLLLPDLAEVVERPSWPFPPLCFHESWLHYKLSNTVAKLCRRLGLGHEVTQAASGAIDGMALFDLDYYHTELASAMSDAVDGNANIIRAALENCGDMVAVSEAHELALGAAARRVILALSGAGAEADLDSSDLDRA